MSDVIQKLKKKYEEDIDEISELRNDALLMRTDSNAKVLAILLKKFIDTADELMISKQEDDRMDKMHESLKEILSGIRDAFKNIKAPDIKPQINFDTQPIYKLVESNNRQNENILKLISGNGKKDAVNNIHIDTKEIASLAAAISEQNKIIIQLLQNKNDEKEEREIKEIGVKRMNGFIDKLIPVYK